MTTRAGRSPLVLLTLALVLVAGCTADPVEKPRLSAAAETREVPPSADFPGLVVQGTLTGDAQALYVAAFARNDGPRTYRVETGCGDPWSQELFRGEERILLHEPLMRCLSLSFKPFQPEERSTYAVSWDGTIWDEGQQRQVAAPPGEYVWSVRFAAYQDESSDSDIAAKRFDLNFPVTVS